jgi:putative flippase GtrA
VIVALLAWLLQDRMALILVSGASTAGGRITSSVLNFYLNKKLVFHSSTNTGVALMRYIMLAVPQMLLQILLTSGVCGLFGVEADGSLAYMLIYCAVMIVLFIFSYTIQQRWVFAPQTKGQEDE